MTTTTNLKIKKKEEIVSRAIQILTTHLTETNGFQKIKEIVCNSLRASNDIKIIY